MKNLNSTILEGSAGAAAAYPLDPALASAITVIAIGNPLLSDDGVGIHALGQLRAERYAPIQARLLNGGTFGPELLAQICNCRKLLLLDAIDVGAPPGSLVRVELDSPAVARPHKASMHDLGINELLDDLRLLNEAPEEVVMLGVQPAQVRLGTDLSREVATAVPALVEAAARQISAWNAGIQSPTTILKVRPAARRLEESEPADLQSSRYRPSEEQRG